MKPSNPNNIVIKNKFVQITEYDLYNFWVKEKETILRNVSKNIFFYFSTELNKSIIRRYEEKNKLINLNNFNYEKKINGHIVGVISTFETMSNFGIVDIDAPTLDICSEEIFNKIKNATYDVYSFLNKFYKCKIIYTGKNGFHIYVDFNYKYKLNTIKELLKNRLLENNDIIAKYTIENKRTPDRINLDLSLNKTSGGYITLGSINKIGLQSKLIKINELDNFDRLSTVII